MNIIDSSLWIEFFMGRLNDGQIKGIIKNPENQYVPSVCLYEVFKKIRAEKDESTAMHYVSSMLNATVISIDSQIAIQAARIGKDFKLPFADSIIYATAQIYDAKLFTQDKHFEGLENVHYFGGAA